LGDGGSLVGALLSSAADGCGWLMQNFSRKVIKHDNQ